MYNPNTILKEPGAFKMLRCDSVIIEQIRTPESSPKQLLKQFQGIYGDAADARWLLTFNQSLEKVRDSCGGAANRRGERKESHAAGQGEAVRVAPGAAHWLLGCCAPAGPTLRQRSMESAIAAEAQWENGVWQEVQIISPLGSRSCRHEDHRHEAKMPRLSHCLTVK